MGHASRALYQLTSSPAHQLTSSPAPQLPSSPAPSSPAPSSPAPQLPAPSSQLCGPRFANRAPCTMGQPIRFSPHGEGGLGHDSLFKTDRPNRVAWGQWDKRKGPRLGGPVWKICGPRYALPISPAMWWRKMAWGRKPDANRRTCSASDSVISSRSDRCRQ